MQMDSHSSSNVSTLFDGSTTLISDKRTVRIPCPSSSLLDPLNLPRWRKYVIVGILTAYTICSLCIITALGGLIVFVAPTYMEQGISRDQISTLLTYPPLFLGLGNLVSMPIAIAIGRRPVLLLANLVLFISTVLLATNKSYAWHLSVRCVAAFAGAQCEALVILIIQDIFFLHQRARAFQVFTSLESLVSACLIVASAYLARAWGWRAWYSLFAALSGLVAALSFFFIPETCYPRPISSYMGKEIPSITPVLAEHAKMDGGNKDGNAVYSSQRQIYGEVVSVSEYRTWKNDLKIAAIKPNFAAGLHTLKEMVTVYIYPHAMWVALLNGLLTAIQVSFQITYGPTLVAEPYNWAKTSVSYIQFGQAVVGILSIFWAGWLPDYLSKQLAKRRNGVHEPEVRLLPLFPPLFLSVMMVTLYGAALQHPGRYHWSLIMLAINIHLLSLLSASTIGTIYLLDAHPTRAAAILVMIPVVRGLVAFGMSKKTVIFLNSIGPLKLFTIYSGTVGAFIVVGLLLTWKGKYIRRLCARF